MIGVFDSGLGGIQTLRYLVDRLPAYTYCYLGDTAGLPYGTKDPTWIRERTFLCCEWLFSRGCKLVILACNSASTYAVRAWQATFPEKKVLSVTVPGVERVVTEGWRSIGVLGTQATIQSNLYPDFFAKHFPDYQIAIEQLVGGELVTLIECDAPLDAIEAECARIIRQFTLPIEALILGCTHYPIVQPQIQKNLPEGVVCIDPAFRAAEKLVEYLDRHSDIESKLDRTGQVFFYTTSDPSSSSELGKKIRGAPYTVQVVDL